MSTNINSSKNIFKYFFMKKIEKNKLECILFNNFHYGRTQLLIVRGILEISKRVFEISQHLV